MADAVTPVLLVDFENIQDLDYLKKLRNTDFEVRVFLGPHQSKLPSSLVRQAQPFGARLQWIQMEGHGKNALDFHISYTIGLLVAEDRRRRIFVLSKDAGFDPLLTYLAKRNIDCLRIEELGKFLIDKDVSPSAPTLSPPVTPVVSPGIKKAVAPPNSPATIATPPAKTLSVADIQLYLNTIPPRTRHKKPKTLAAHLASHFKKQAPNRDFAQIVKELAKLGEVSIDGDKLSYHKK